MRLVGGKWHTVCCVVGSLFPTMEAKFQVKHRIECGWVQADDLCMIIIF